MFPHDGGAKASPEAAGAPRHPGAGSGAVGAALTGGYVTMWYAGMEWYNACALLKPTGQQGERTGSTLQAFSPPLSSFVWGH